MSDYQEALAKTSVVQVTWLDHVIFSSASWRDAADELKPATIKSVGFVVRNNKEYIELAETLDTESPISGNHRVILRSCISDIKVLR